MFLIKIYLYICSNKNDKVLTKKQMDIWGIFLAGLIVYPAFFKL